MRTPTFRSLFAFALALCGVAAVLLASRPAAAQSRFGTQRQLVISAEDLMGYSSQTVSWSAPNGVDLHDTSSHFSFLTNSASVVGGPFGQGSMIGIGPRVGGHYFLAPSISIGGSIGYESFGGSVTAQAMGGNNPTVSADKGSTTVFTLMPKVGYALMLTDIFGFWFRGGLGLVTGTAHANAANDVPNTSWHFWLIDLEALFIVSPVPHLGFYAGPGFDLTFTGSQTQEVQQGGANGPVVSTSQSVSYHRFNLGFGMVGFFDL